MERYLEAVLTPQCYQDLLVNINLLNFGCLQLLLSKLIGFTIILLSSVFMKLPQVVKMLQSRSSQGVSLLSQSTMLLTSSAAVGYSLAKNFPFSTWGESIALSVQTLAICVLILVYRDQYRAAVLYTIGYFLWMVLLLAPTTPLSLHVGLQLAGLPLNVLSRGAQIWLTYRSGGTGQLSGLYVVLMNLRSAGRLYTTLTETGDPLRAANYGLQTALNALLTLQVLYYGGLGKRKPKLKEG